jgi:thymidylate synthase
MIAQQTGYKPYEFIHSTADSHIYWDQIDAIKQYLASPKIDSPTLTIKKAPSITEYQLSDFQLADFQSGPKIEIPVAV